MTGHTIRDQVNNLNELGTEELDRWIKMHVLRVEATVPDFVTKRRRRRLAPRAYELTKDVALDAIAILQAGLDRDLPGTIGLTFYGMEEM